MEYINRLPIEVTEINIECKNLSILPDLSRFTCLQKLDCSPNLLTQLDNLPSSLQYLDCTNNKMNNINLEYWKEITKNKKLKLLKEKISARKIQRIWKKYWYDFYKYELIDGKYIGFCRCIEKSYSIINENSI